MNQKIQIIVRGGGDLATGIIHRLYRAGFRVLILETDRPSSIRRQVSFSEAVYDGEAVVENVKAVRIGGLSEMEAVYEEGAIPLLVDPEGCAVRVLKPDILVDAIIAKKNLGTERNMAQLVIGVGPGFTAGKDVHYVIETMRGHDLARIISEGAAVPNTGIPGNIGGYTSERVLHAPCAGVIRNIEKIGAFVEKGQEIARIYPDESFTGDYTSVEATISGIIRGLIREGYRFKEGFKIADIDPRESEFKNCFTISDKSRSIGGSVLELVSAFANGGM